MTDPHLHARFLASRNPDAKRPPDHGWAIIAAIIVLSFAVAGVLAVMAYNAWSFI